jgi:SAM-dependent methyltransferase
MNETADTFARSCEHWSENARDEMEAFYELAKVDYRYLAEAYDWSAGLQALASRKPGLRLIDVACGSGKFPEALLEHSGLGAIRGIDVHYDLLDPSAFSVQEAKQVLASPFRPAKEFYCTLQNWDAEAAAHDIAWATHALYCVPAEELELGLSRMCQALSQEGFGFVAQGLRNGHYVSFYDYFRESLRKGQDTAYSDGDQVEAALRQLGMAVRRRDIEYTTVVPASRPQLLESYLQRCAFDDTVSLEAMLQREPLAGYLRDCFDPEANEYCFMQRVGMILFAHSDAALILRDSDSSHEA